MKLRYMNLIHPVPKKLRGIPETYMQADERMGLALDLDLANGVVWIEQRDLETYAIPYANVAKWEAENQSDVQNMRTIKANVQAEPEVIEAVCAETQPDRVEEAMKRIEARKKKH